MCLTAAVACSGFLLHILHYVIRKFRNLENKGMIVFRSSGFGKFHCGTLIVTTCSLNSTKVHSYRDELVSIVGRSILIILILATTSLSH